MEEIIREIKSIYAEAFKRHNYGAEPPEIEISFYPYVGINHTIRIRDGKVFVRIAEIFRDAPMDVQRALASILVSKIMRRRVPKADLANYQAFVKTDFVQTQALENRRTRGRKIVTTARGEIYDLEEIFDWLNRTYFQAAPLEKPILTWSARATFQRLGHHDSTHQTLVISKSLDDRRVPRFVVEYVVYHEMLHIKHPTVHHNGRRYNHTPIFRRDEEKFARFAEAERWIEENAYALKKRVKSQNRRRF